MSNQSNYLSPFDLQSFQYVLSAGYGSLRILIIVTIN